MAQIIDIRRVTVGPKSLTARVRIATGAPLMTSDDLEGTTRVYRLLPHIIEHICLGDSGETFKDVMGDTEIAHLLEHVTVELLAQSDIAGDVTCGRTWAVADERRTYDVDFPRDYVHVEDLAEAHYLGLRYIMERNGSEQFNLGSSEGFTVLELIKEAERVTGGKIPYELAERRPGDPATLIAANKKAREILGWEPKRSDLGTILKDAWNWERNRKY